MSNQGARRGKYNARRTLLDGITFDSAREATRYSELKLLLFAGKIKNLRLQVEYRLEVNGSLICKYFPDFVYEENGKETVEDAKGFRTEGYKIKKKLMAALYGIRIKEV